MIDWFGLIFGRARELIVPRTFPETAEAAAIVAEVEQRVAVARTRQVAPSRQRAPEVEDVVVAAREAPCEPLRAAEDDLSAGWVRGSGAPPRSACPPVRILSWDAYDAWLLEHELGGEA